MTMYHHSASTSAIFLSVVGQTPDRKRLKEAMASLGSPFRFCSSLGSESHDGGTAPERGKLQIRIWGEENASFCINFSFSLSLFSSWPQSMRWYHTHSVWPAFPHQLILPVLLSGTCLEACISRVLCSSVLSGDSLN